MDKEKLQQAKDYAFKLLSYRDRSRYELVNRLDKKGYSEDIITEVISVLSNLNYIDDTLFAQKWVKDRIKNNPRGPYLLSYELKKKGINSNIIDTVINELLTEDTEFEIAETLANKWLNINRNKENYLLKLKRYLHNKGISDSIIRKYISLNE